MRADAGVARTGALGALVVDLGELIDLLVGGGLLHHLHRLRRPELARGHALQDVAQRRLGRRRGQRRGAVAEQRAARGGPQRAGHGGQPAAGAAQGGPGEHADDRCSEAPRSWKRREAGSQAARSGSAPIGVKQLKPPQCGFSLAALGEDG